MARRRKKEQLSPGLRALRTIGIVVVLFLIYTFAVQDTEINLKEPLEPRRQETAIRVLRALARPDFFTYDEEIRSMDITIRMPCGDEIKGSQTSLGERVVTLAPNCASTTQEILTLTGSGFRPRTSGLLRWHPPGAIATMRALTTFRTDADGRFEIEFAMPDIRPTDEPQRIEVEEKWQTGISGLSTASIITLEKITETILLALLATTVGTFLSSPISFISARNLMETVGSPLAAVMSGVVALVIGYWGGRELTSLLISGSLLLGSSSMVQLGGAVVLFAAAWGSLRVGPSVISTKEQTTRSALIALGRVAGATILALSGIAFLSRVGMVFGLWLAELLGPFGFIGSFFALAAEFFLVAAPGIVGFILGMMTLSYGSRFGQEAVLRWPAAPARLLTIIATGLGTAVLVWGFGAMVNWLYVIDNPLNWTLYPALIGGGLGAAAAAFITPKRLMPVGLITYTVVRSILNVIRSIEPLVYVITFAVWVGIGPFAGVLALTLHTVAALGKLFSEQVENISEGPLEAITATGATALQRVVFAVIPQIVPPYIAFTLYRWDINVRMSTIIGFGGGGGIGFVLAQAINLLQYRQAAVMMIAIAIVVGTLDYISSEVRSRIL